MYQVILKCIIILFVFNNVKLKVRKLKNSKIKDSKILNINFAANNCFNWLESLMVTIILIYKRWNSFPSDITIFQHDSLKIVGDLKRA